MAVPVNELVTRFSFVGSLEPQESFNEGLAQSITLLGAAATGIATSAGGLFAFVAASTEAADALTDMNAETGISVERIQELGFAAELSGSSAEAMTASLAGLSKVAGDAARGLGRGKKSFDELGISVKDANGNVKTADVLFGELGDKFKKLGTDAATQKSIIASLGLDPSTLQLLNATGEEVDALIAKSRALGIVTTEQAEAAAEFQDALGIAKFGVNALRQQVAVGLAPAMTDITNRFIGFLEANNDLIEDGLKYLGEIIMSTMGFIERMGPILLMAAAAFGVATLATGGFAAVMGFVMSPVVLITAAIVALLLIVDDLITAFNGGQSVIADFFNEFLGIDIVPIMHGVVDAFMGMVDAVIALIGVLWDAWKQFSSAIVKVFTGDWSGALNDLLGAFNSLGEAIKMVFSGVFDYLAGIMGQVFGAIRNAAVSILPDWAVKLLGGDASGVPGGAPGSAAPGESGAPGAPGEPGTPGSPGAPGPAQPLPSGSGQDRLDVPMITPNEAVNIGGATANTVNNSTVEQQVEIKISSNDPKAAGAAVNDSLQDQLKTAKTQVNRGGR